MWSSVLKCFRLLDAFQTAKSAAEKVTQKGSQETCLIRLSMRDARKPTLVVVYLDDSNEVVQKGVLFNMNEFVVDGSCYSSFGDVLKNVPEFKKLRSM